MAILHGRTEPVAVENELHSIFDRFIPGQWTCLVPGEMTVTHSGLCFVYFDDRFLQMGYGIHAGLTPSRGVLDVVAKYNGDNPFVHAWLSPHVSSGSEEWSVMCGYKMFYHWLTLDRMHNFTFQIMQSQHHVVAEMSGELAPFGGYPFWNPDASFPEVTDPAERIRLAGFSLVASLKPVVREMVEHAASSDR